MTAPGTACSPSPSSILSIWQPYAGPVPPQPLGKSTTRRKKTLNLTILGTLEVTYDPTKYDPQKIDKALELLLGPNSGSGGGVGPWAGRRDMYWWYPTKRKTQNALKKLLASRLEKKMELISAIVDHRDQPSRSPEVLFSKGLKHK